MQLDMRTAIVFAALGAWLMAGATLVVLRTFPDRGSGVRLWAAGAATQGLGWLLVALRDLLSERTAIVVAGLAFVLAAGFCIGTVREFRRDLRRALFLRPCLVGATAAAVGLLAAPVRTEAIVAIAFATVAATFGLVGLRFDRRQADLLRLATLDPLTECLNRAEIESRIGAELARSDRHGSPASLLMLDVDRFKSINDAHGHAAGDAALRAVAELLRKRTRISDVIGRYGGDEFVVLLPGAPLAQAVAAAERLLVAVEAIPMTTGARAIPLTISAGVAGHAPGGDAASLIHRTDAALYEAKSRGRNRVVAAEG